MMQRRLIRGGPNRFSGQCDPAALKVFAGPTPLEISAVPVLAGDEILRLARAEYEIPNPDDNQLTLF